MKVKIEDHILQLMVKKLTGEATDEESQELNDLLESNPVALTLMQLLLKKWATDELISDEEIHRSFVKLMNRIKQAVSHHSTGYDLKMQAAPPGEH